MARVLVVDDDPVIRELLVVNLEMEGYETVTAADGSQALAAVASSAPDLLLLDVMMPAVSGWQVAEALKGDPATAGIPIVMLTARAMEADVRKGTELRVDRYVTKPFDPMDLMDVCHELLAARGAQEGT